MEVQGGTFEEHIQSRPRLLERASLEEHTRVEKQLLEEEGETMSTKLQRAFQEWLTHQLREEEGERSREEATIFQQLQELRR